MKKFYALFLVLLFGKFQRNRGMELPLKFGLKEKERSKHPISLRNLQT